MNKEKFTEIMNQIKEKVTDETGEVSNLLADLYDGFDGVFNERDTLKTKNTELNTNNETLKEQNMKLYLRVGQPTDTSKAGADSDKGNDDEMSYDDLFNEEGELI